MCNIAESNMLLRVHAELPTNLKLATEEFSEGWRFARRAKAGQLEKKICQRGWSFIKIADGVMRSGVGDTSQLATSSALKLTLRHVSEHFNAAEIEHIELTQYPWFFLARIRVYPYLIQQGDTLPVSDDTESLPIIPRRRRLVYAHDLYPDFGSTMLQLRQMLISPQDSERDPQ